MEYTDATIVRTFNHATESTMTELVTTTPEMETIDLKGYIGALTGFGASDATSKGAWGALVKSVAVAIAEGKGRDRVEAEMAMAEDEYKRVNSVTALPSAWRSAKAVALKAVDQGLDLIDEDGVPIGKTEAERTLSGKGSKTDFEKATESANRVVKLGRKLTDSEKEAIRTILAGF
jgi:hypothetical protein